MMYLARRERGKIARVYQVLTEKTPPRTWEFMPHLGYEVDYNERPSLLCLPGVCAMANTPTAALNMLHSVFPASYA